jgi:hypothetical protein
MSKPPGCLSFLEECSRSARVVKSALRPLSAAATAEDECQVRLADTGRPEEEDVLFAVD